MSKCTLFADIKPDDLELLFGCLGANIKSYSKGAFIAIAGDNLHDVGIIISGSVNILREDYWGGRQILSNLVPGELFGESFLYSGLAALPVSVQAMEKSEVLFINPSRIANSCTKNCSFHSSIINNMMRILAVKNVKLTQKIEHVTRRSIREKVLAYLSNCALTKGAESFEIPFDRQELADYLAVDRSALSAELSKMQRESLISFNKNKFTIYRESAS